MSTTAAPKKEFVKTRNFEFIEVEIDVKSAKIKIGAQDLLQGKKIKSITAFRVDNVTKTPNGAALANANAFKCSFLLLRIKGKDRINQLPLSDFDPTLQNGKRWEFPNAVEVDWTNSYITCSDKDQQTLSEAYLLYVEFEMNTAIKEKEPKK